jgi:hypothetical protein
VGEEDTNYNDPEQELEASAGNAEDEDSSAGEDLENLNEEANQYITQDDEGGDPGRARGVQASMQSHIAWNMDHNSPIRDQFNSFESGGLQPYNSAKQYIGEAADAVYGAQGGSSLSARQSQLSVINQSIYSRYGNSVRVTGTGIYNRTIGKTGSIIGSNQEQSDITLYKPPRGLVQRPIDRDWNAFQEEHKGLNLRESVYQLQESSYIGGLMSRGPEVKTDILTQGVRPIVVKDREEQSQNATKRMLSVLGGNEVSLSAFEGTNVNANKVTLRNEGQLITPAFHAKLGYYYDDNKNIVAGTIGSQNRTDTLRNRDSLEEALFLSMDMVADSNKEAKDKMLSVLREIGAATDAMFSTAGKDLTSLGARRLTQQAFRKSLIESTLEETSQFVKLNRDVHETRLRHLRRLSKSPSESQVILSVQYLESTLFGAKHGVTDQEGSSAFLAYKKSFFKVIESLSQQGRLTLVTTQNSRNEGEGIYSIFDRLNDDKQVFDLFGEEDSSKTKARIKEIISSSASIAPTQLRHSKGFAVLSKELDKLEMLEVSSANLSFTSYARNIEAGIFLGERDIQDLNLNNEETLSYYRSGLMSKMSNRGLYVESKGDSKQVSAAVEMLTALGGKESRQQDRSHPFRFSKRYNMQGEATGLDIVLKNVFRFSVTIGSTQESRYDPMTGQQVVNEVPVVYINKGNRVITGMEWLNKSTRTVAVESAMFDTYNRSSGPKVIQSGESVSLDALQVLGGIVYTMNQGMAYEENTRIMLHSLKKLLEQGDSATLLALRSAGFTEAESQQKLSTYKELVLSKNVGAITKRSQEVGNVISFNAVASSFFKRTMQQRKSELYTRLIEIYPQSHELSYSQGQLAWKRPLYGLTPEVEDIHFSEKDDFIYTRGFLLSEMPVEHTEYLTDKDGLPLLRGASESARPTTLNPDEMLGGLVQVKGGVSTPYSMQLFNSIQGLSMFTYADYSRRLDAMGIDSSSDYGQQLLDTVFALEKRKQEEIEEGSWDRVKQKAVMLYTPYDKTEQNIQRLKNLKSVRPFLPANLDFASFLRSFGAEDESGFMQKTQEAAKAGIDIEGSDLVGGVIPFGLPSAQFELLKKYQMENPDADIVKYARSIAIDTDEVTQGFIEAPKLVMVNMGINEMSDYSYLNTEYANSNENAYLKTYRSQTALSTKEMNMTPAQFNALIREKLQVGTIFVARDVKLQDAPHLSETNRQLENKVLTFIKLTSDIGEMQYSIDKDFSMENLKSADIKKALKEMRRLSQEGHKSVSFAEAVDFREGGFVLKKGVYQMKSSTDGWLKKIGSLNDGENAFYIDGINTYTSLGEKSRIQPFRVKAPAYSGREMNAISYLYKTPTSSEQDLRSNMVTYNLEMVNIADLKTGQRTAEAKGPFKGTNRDYFLEIGAVYGSEVGYENLPTEITGKEIFAAITMGQMKGFVFKAGLGFLREGEKSNTWKMITDTDQQTAGYKIAEALSLMMLGDTTSGATETNKISALLKGAYERGAISNRRQAQSALKLIVEGTASAKNLAQKNQSDKLQRDFAPTIAVYEGIMSLVDEGEVESGKTPEQALIDTIGAALKAGKEGDAARAKLAQKTENLFKTTRDQYGKQMPDGGYYYDETKSRSASVMAFFLNAAKDVLTDINPERRLLGKAVTEIAYNTDGFFGVYLKNEEVARKVDREISTVFNKIILGIENEKGQLNPMQKAVHERKISSLEEMKKQSIAYMSDTAIDFKDKSIEGLMNAAGVENDLFMSKAYTPGIRKNLTEIFMNYGGLDAESLLLYRDQEYGKEANVYRKAVRQQTLALGIEMPSIERIWKLQDKSSRTDTEASELETLQNELQNTLTMMRGLGQFGLRMALPFDMTINKITVPTGMEDTTALEGHYANALTDKQLQLYTYSGDDKEKARSLQQTMVILGSMLQEGLGTTLDQSDVSEMYSIRRTNAILMGYKNYTDLENESESGIDAQTAGDRARRNRMRRAIKQEVETNVFSLSFSQSYGDFTARSRDNVFPRYVSSRAKDIAPAEEVFFQFIRSDAEGYESALQQMEWSRRVSSDRTNLDRTERARAITKDYLRRLKNSETIVGGQVEDLLSGITDRALSQLSSLQEVEAAMFSSSLIENDPGVTEADATIENWADKLSPDTTKRAIAILKSRKIAVPDNATKEDIAKIVKEQKGTIRSLPVEDQLELASLGFTEMALVLGDGTGSLSEVELTRLSADTKRTAFVQLLLREKFKEVLKTQTGLTASQTLSETSTLINNLTSIEERVSAYIKDAPEIQERLLYNLIKNEVDTKLKQSADIDPGKEYIQGKQKLREYARQFLEAGLGTTEEQSRARSIIDSVDKTYSVTIPVLQIQPSPTDEGTYKAQIMPETEIEGWMLGLDVLERMSLVFPGHTHEALRAQYGLADSLARANDTGLFEEMAQAVMERREVNLSAEQLDVYNTLVNSAEIAKEQTLHLSKNKDTFRQTMADRLSLTGSSFIAMNSFLVGQSEVALGSRIDTLLKENSGSGLRTLMDTIVDRLIDSHQKAVSSETVRIDNRIAELSAATDPESSAEISRLREDRQRLVNDLILDPNSQNRIVQSTIKYAQLTANILQNLSDVIQGPDAKTFSYEDLLERVKEPVFQKEQQAAQAAEEAANAKKAAGAVESENAAKPREEPRSRYVRGQDLKEALISDIGGEPTDDGYKQLESVVFRSMVTANRQGAPSGTFHTFGNAHQQISPEEMAKRAKLFGSLQSPDLATSNTGMFISSLGFQFTQLGDYDGDSFQAAFTKMADSTREVVDAFDKVKKAEAEFYASEENQDAPHSIIRMSAVGAQTRSLNKLTQTINDYVEKLEVLAELRQEVENRGVEKVRNYITDFMALPAEFMEGLSYGVGAITDEDIPSLIKQSRDTQANFYGNQNKVQSSLGRALATVSDITLNQDIGITFREGAADDKLQQAYTETLNKVGKDFIEYSTDAELRSFNQASIKEKSQKLIEFSALMSQRLAALGDLGKVSSKVAGSLLNTSAFANIQAIVGSTGTGLLGKTYNTVVPLLGMAVSDLASMRAMKEAADGTDDKMGTAFVEALQRQQLVLRQRLQNAETAKEQTAAQTQLDIFNDLLQKYQDKQTVPYKIAEAETQKRLNATFGLLLDVQQFLRDAALKPKKGGSVALEAAEFEYTYETQSGERKTLVGLDTIMNTVDEVERSKVMERFIGTRAGAVLAQDYGFEFKEDGKVVVSDNKLDTSELRVFAALEMVNEYLSGKKTATEMLKESTFAGFFRQRKEQMIEQDPDRPIPTDEFIVQTTLADSLAKFRSEFIYNAVLEAADYKPMLQKFAERLQDGYSEENLRTRTLAYEETLRGIYEQQMPDGASQLTKDVEADINSRTQSWRAEQERVRDVIAAAATRADSNANTTLGEEVFRSLIEYQTQREAQIYVGTDTEAGLFDQLISLNRAVQGLQSGQYATPGTAQQYEIAQTAILYNISRGKLEGTTFNESIFRLATEVQSVGGSAEAVGALLAVGGGTSLPGLMEFIQQQAQERAGGDTSRADELVRQSLVTLGEILTTQVETGATQRQSVAEIIAEKSVVSASSSKIQQELAALNDLELEARQRIQEGASDEEASETLDVIKRYREERQKRLESVQSNPQEAVNRLNEDFDPVAQALNDVQEQIGKNVAESIKAQHMQKKSQNITKVQEEAYQKQVRSNTLSLLAVPLLFSVMSGDVPITDRVAELARNMIESALTLSQQQGSVTQRILSGEGSGTVLAETLRPPNRQVENPVTISPDEPLTRDTVRTERQRRTAARTAQTIEPDVDEKPTQTSYLEKEQEDAERNTGRANYLLRVARAREFMFSAEGKPAGLAQSVAFEALNTAGAYASSQFAQNTRLLRDDSVLGRGALEVMGGVVGMALANVVTKRPITGTDFTYDAAFDLTVQAVSNVKDNVIAASRRALAEAINGEDIDITDGYTGESLEAILAEGDFMFDDDNTSLSAVERVMITEGMLEEEESLPIEQGED